MISNLNDLTKLDLSNTNLDLGLFIKSTKEHLKNNEKLKTLLLNGLSTKITNFNSLFSDFIYLETLSLTELNIIKQNNEEITMENMFSGCKSLKNLFFNNIYTDKIVDVSNMCKDCVNLTFLNFSKLNLSNVQNMDSMFEGCTNLTGVKFSNNIYKHNTKINSMKYMFKNCKNLKRINLSSFIFEKCTRQESMFFGCNTLENITLSSFVKGIDDMQYRFSTLAKMNKSTSIKFKKCNN